MYLLSIGLFLLCLCCYAVCEWIFIWRNVTPQSNNLPSACLWDFQLTLALALAMILFILFSSAHQNLCLSLCYCIYSVVQSTPNCVSLNSLKHAQGGQNWILWHDWCIQGYRHKVGNLRGNRHINRFSLMMMFLKIEGSQNHSHDEISMNCPGPIPTLQSNLHNSVQVSAHITLRMVHSSWTEFTLHSHSLTREICQQESVRWRSFLCSGWFWKWWGQPWILWPNSLSVLSILATLHLYLFILNDSFNHLHTEVFSAGFKIMELWFLWLRGGIAHLECKQQLQLNTIMAVFFFRPRLFPEVDTGFRQSQASLIWRELEEDEEGHDEAPRRSFLSGLRRRQAPRTRDEDRAEGHRQHTGRMSDCPDDDRARYFVLGTLAAVFALMLNLIYPLLYKSNWAWITAGGWITLELRSKTQDWCFLGGSHLSCDSTVDRPHVIKKKKDAY